MDESQAKTREDVPGPEPRVTRDENGTGTGGTGGTEGTQSYGVVTRDENGTGTGGSGGGKNPQAYPVEGK